MDGHTGQKNLQREDTGAVFFATNFDATLNLTEQSADLASIPFPNSKL
jgi:hypothetical protein